MRRTLLLIGFTTVLAGCSGAGSVGTVTLTSHDGDKTVNVQVEIADTPEARRIGLMNRETLPENQGMLFAFEEPDQLKFWMENTLIPLDIIYFNGTGEFINAYTMEPCKDVDPCPTYISAEPAQFALEVPSGFREEQGIGVGWKINVKQIQRMVDFK